ncbi:hypothetical protein F5883DRAFT_688106 [Diaporthe sp. PMI_573]|nr:hypothetical protein F5883DRAFT_688106 [Diaporthaceae sp. PMI_573]
MPDERTGLLSAPVGPSTTGDGSQGFFSYDRDHAARSAAYKLGSYSAVFKAFSAECATPEPSVAALEQASKANRKPTAIADALQAYLGLIDQAITMVMAFSKAGCSWVFACVVAAIILGIAFFLQRNSKEAIAEVLANRRQKETEAGNDLFSTYANSQRKLLQSECDRRHFVLLVFGFLMVVANPPEPHNLMLALPSILHTDEKLGKMWKATADMQTSLLFLRAHYPPDQAPQQEITQHPASRPRPASRLCEIWGVLRDSTLATNAAALRDSTLATNAAQIERIWRGAGNIRSRWHHTGAVPPIDGDRSFTDMALT